MGDQHIVKRKNTVVGLISNSDVRTNYLAPSDLEKLAKKLFKIAKKNESGRQYFVFSDPDIIERLDKEFSV